MDPIAVINMAASVAAVLLALFAIRRSGASERARRMALLRAALIENADNLMAWRAQRPVLGGTGTAVIVAGQLREFLVQSNLPADVIEFVNWQSSAISESHVSNLPPDAAQDSAESRARSRRRWDDGIERLLLMRHVLHAAGRELGQGELVSEFARLDRLEWPTRYPGWRMDHWEHDRARGAPRYPAGEAYRDCEPMSREQLNFASLTDYDSLIEAARRGITGPADPRARSDSRRSAARSERVEAESVTIGGRANRTQ